MHHFCFFGVWQLLWEPTVGFSQLARGVHVMIENNKHSKENLVQDPTSSHPVNSSCPHFDVTPMRLRPRSWFPGLPGLPGAPNRGHVQGGREEPHAHPHRPLRAGPKWSSHPVGPQAKGSAKRVWKGEPELALGEVSGECIICPCTPLGMRTDLD